MLLAEKVEALMHVQRMHDDLIEVQLILNGQDQAVIPVLLRRDHKEIRDPQRIQGLKILQLRDLQADR